MTKPKSEEQATLASARVPIFRLRETFPKMAPEYAAAVGQVTVSWSLLEDFVASIIHYMSDTEGEAGRALTAEMPFMLRVSTVGALMHCTRNRLLLTHWEDICRFMEPLRAARNDVVHAEWRVSGDIHRMIRTKARGKVVYRSEVVPIDRLIALESHIVDMIDQLTWFTSQLAR